MLSIIEPEQSFKPQGLVANRKNMIVFFQQGLFVNFKGRPVDFQIKFKVLQRAYKNQYSTHTINVLNF